MADLVMVGAGPQALALSCLLLQKRSRLHRRLRIVDPSGRWLGRWQRQVQRYEITWLRSPSPPHPHPNANALRRFAHNQQRHRQLEGRYGLPHTDLFAAFCRGVISEFALEGRVQAASIEHISLPANGKDPLELSLSDGTIVQAVLADPAFGPSRAEGFAAVVAVVPSHGRELEALLRDELARLDHRIRSARNREKRFALHGYSHLLDLERLLHLLRLLTTYPELSGATGSLDRQSLGAEEHH